MAWLSGQITALRSAMSREAGTTDDWKRSARELTALIRQRNDLRTPEEIHQIEKRRGLA